MTRDSGMRTGQGTTNNKQKMGMWGMTADVSDCSWGWKQGATGAGTMAKKTENGPKRCGKFFFLSFSLFIALLLTQHFRYYQWWLLVPPDSPPSTANNGWPSNCSQGGRQCKDRWQWQNEDGDGAPWQNHRRGHNRVMMTNSAHPSPGCRCSWHGHNLFHIRLYVTVWGHW